VRRAAVQTDLSSMALICIVQEERREGQDFISEVELREMFCLECETMKAS
jgi:hypothetical protein